MITLITNTHRVVAVQSHTRRIEDKPRSTDELHSLLRWELMFERELETVLAVNMALAGRTRVV